MKLLVMSDTHGDAEIIQTVKNRHPEVDVVIHCGDSELDYKHPYFEGVKRVRGNCDRDKRFPEEELFEVEGKKIYVTHGHLYNVKSTTMNLFYRAKEVEADAVFFGHSHVLGAELVENTMFVNPGSLLKPRGLDKKSYAVIEFKDNLWKFTAYTDNGEEIAQKEFRLE
ncbi:metallophosphoesterase [Ureibacillus thermophilus]|uniref:Phosphoesterase n=1 Tax=Ureibacillus thermophilus TaxID=367743 RepID=A0A4P6UV82_9BACL|nr:metallophosphoesterase [Ureibacillus thermophilus]QBK26445.1 metallophosphoesterase [Ureibacillus thermophilus]